MIYYYIPDQVQGNWEQWQLTHMRISYKGSIQTGGALSPWHRLLEACLLWTSEIKFSPINIKYQT